MLGLLSADTIKEVDIKSFYLVAEKNATPGAVARNCTTSQLILQLLCRRFFMVVTNLDAWVCLGGVAAFVFFMLNCYFTQAASSL